MTSNAVGKPVWVTVLVASLIALVPALLHLSAIITLTAWRADMHYDFHRYGQLLYGAVWATAAITCVMQVGAIRRGEPVGKALAASALLVVLHAPVVPIQPYSAIPMTAGLVNLFALAWSRKAVSRREQQADG
jgi:hypothetical protein